MTNRPFSHPLLLPLHLVNNCYGVVFPRHDHVFFNMILIFDILFDFWLRFGLRFFFLEPRSLFFLSSLSGLHFSTTFFSHSIDSSSSSSSEEDDSFSILVF